MDNKRINWHQLLTLTGVASLGGSVLAISATVSGVAERDAWMSTILAVALGVPVMLLFLYLARSCPGMTLIGITKQAFGKWIGLIISALYVLVFLKISFDLPWYIGNYFGRIMHETPQEAISIIFVLAMAIGVLYGIETIARATEVFFIAVTGLIILIVALLIKDVHVEYLSPTLENGVLPVVKGAFLLLCFISFTSVSLMMIFPIQTNISPGVGTALVKGFLWAGAVIFATITMSTLILGSKITAITSYPTLQLAGEINIGVVFTRMEYAVSLLWLMSNFTISIVFFYAATKSLSELIGLKKHQPIVLPLAMLTLVMSHIVYPNAIYQGNWSTTVYPPMITTFGLVFPGITALVLMVRRRFAGKRARQ